MTASRTHLGDSHNFGRRVTRRSGRIVKPRTTLWEWLLLAERSPLRRLLRKAATSDGLGADAFEFLPTLQFFGSKLRGGEVQALELAPLERVSSARRRELAGVVGRSLALFSWLGVADLHWENLVLGVDDRARIVFGPLDVEMILADLSSPTETKLLPDADPEYAAICRHAAGVRRVLPYLGKPVTTPDLLAMAFSYWETLALLDRHGAAIGEALSALSGLREAPIRVCLRGTAEYVTGDPTTLWPPLLDAEAEQLARGDIPYFFRLYGQPGIHYYGNASLRERKRIPLKGDVPRLDPLLALGRGLRSPSRQKLREEGLFALLGAFDHAALSGQHSVGELQVSFGARRIVARLPSGEELSARRNLSAFVGSVYLPCRCGEVRSVFVPEVTVCRTVRARV